VFRRASLASLLIATGLSGAFAPAVAQPVPVVHPLTFDDPVVLPGSGDTSSVPADGICTLGCAEPMITTGPDGSLYVSAPRSLLICCNARTSPIWRSADGGETWGEPFAPTSPGGAWNALTGGDTSLVVDKRGTIYVGELWVGNDSFFYSRDGGQTWTSTPAHHPDAFTDREWLVYSEHEDAIYGVYNGPIGLTVVKAELAGGQDPPLVWTDWDPDAINHRGSVPLPSVDQGDGTVYVPHLRADPLGEAVGLAVSTDGGDSWAHRPIPGTGSTDAANIFLVSAVDRAGTVYVAWSAEEPDGHTLYYASSTDKGVTWNPPVAVSEGASRTAVFPAITAGAGGRAAVAWYGTDDAVGDPDGYPASTRWHVATATVVNADTAEPVVDVAVVQDDHHRGSMWMGDDAVVAGDRTLLDFFDLELDPATGRIVVVYSRDLEDRVEIVSAVQTEGCNLAERGAYIGPGVEASEGPPPTVC